MNLELPDINLISLNEASIHLSSQIQPHGVLLVLEEPELKILQVSTNTLNIFGITLENVLQKKLEDLLDPFQIQIIKTGLSGANLDFINSTKVWLQKKVMIT